MRDSRNSPTSLRELAASWWEPYPPGHERAGHPIERRTVCECGRAFTQYILSARQLAAAERMGVLPLFEAQTPGFWLPVHCLPCERVDLGRQARVDEARRTGTASRTYPDDRRSA